jgi:hypothetical protein
VAREAKKRARNNKTISGTGIPNSSITSTFGSWVGKAANATSVTSDSALRCACFQHPENLRCYSKAAQYIKKFSAIKNNSQHN